ncbi:S24/S26 family peptidase [Chloracidobacterium sp. MS 40/45]|uniref:S24/S26 family peptidase n=1 Tax=Chloracidobacterium aggregatum TaxID=2851959 RepID=UPI001B8C8BD5|nr:S24/S26 family peptidase [Chloracidobacterium aggregatum]QUW01580.1 S24/S26 family peptidase [Chloracidobacterium sp. MS 40/45]
MTNAGWTTLVRSLLAQGLPVRFTAPGRSMAPTIADGETITVRPLSADDRPECGEVVLAQVDDRLIAHRIVEMHPAADGTWDDTWFVLRGDAQGQATDVVPRRAILGCVVLPPRSCRARLAGAVWRLRQRCARWKPFLKPVLEKMP